VAAAAAASDDVEDDDDDDDHVDAKRDERIAVHIQPVYI